MSLCCIVIIDILFLLLRPCKPHTCVDSQAVEWLGELLDALLKTHIRLGDDAQETKALLEKHKKFVDVAQVLISHGKLLTYMYRTQP